MNFNITIIFISIFSTISVFSQNLTNQDLARASWSYDKTIVNTQSTEVENILDQEEIAEVIQQFPEAAEEDIEVDNVAKVITKVSDSYVYYKATVTTAKGPVQATIIMSFTSQSMYATVEELSPKGELFGAKQREPHTAHSTAATGISVYVGKVTQYSKPIYHLNAQQLARAEKAIQSQNLDGLSEQQRLEVEFVLVSMKAMGESAEELKKKVQNNVIQSSGVRI